jgi:predicted transcriptional regulator
MDLQGKIEKFNVPEIFQLIASGKRTGTLGIVRNNQATMFYFKGGQVTYAYLPTNHNRVGERLLQKGFIDNTALDAALTKQKESKGENRIGKILIDAKRINEQQLATVLTEQISDIVYRVMSWDTGLFKFYDDKFPTTEDNSLSLSTESLILDGAKRADELGNLKNKLPLPNTRLAWKHQDDNRKVDLSLDSREWDILISCNGNHTIDDIINRVDHDPAAVYNALLKFIEMDIIEPVNSDSNKSVDSSHLELQIDILAGLLNRFLDKA